MGKRVIDTNCKICRSEIHKVYYRKNAETIKGQFKTYYRKNKARHQATVARWLKKNRWAINYMFAKQRAKELGLPFKVNGKFYKELMKAPMLCEMTKKQLKRGKGKVTDRSPFVMRMDRTKGFDEKNLRLLSREVALVIAGRAHRKNRK